MKLAQRSIAVLAFPGYQELEFWYPVLRGREEGASVVVVTHSPMGCESYLGYPVVGDTAADEVDIDQLDALVVPGTVSGRPAPSDLQRQLIKAVHAADRPVYAVGSGADLVHELVGSVDPNRVGLTTDSLPDLFRRLLAELGG